MTRVTVVLACLGQPASEVPLSWHNRYESVPSLSEVSQFGLPVLWSAPRGRARGYRQRNAATCRGPPGFDSDHCSGRPASRPLTGRVFLARLGPLPRLSPQSPAPWGCCVGIGHNPPHPPQEPTRPHFLQIQFLPRKHNPSCLDGGLLGAGMFWVMTCTQSEDPEGACYRSAIVPTDS